MKKRLVLNVLILALLFSGAVLLSTAAHLLHQRLSPPKVRAMRIDPAYLYKHYATIDVAQIAGDVVRDALDMGVNTVILQAYNSNYGAFYVTDLPYAAIEPGVGKRGIFTAVIRAAHAAGLATVASVPVNDFRSVWEAHPGWRAASKDGSDYRPSPDTHPLSVWSDGYRRWYSSFLSDLLQRHPDLDGLELSEGRVDYHWKGEADFNPELLEKFRTRYPQAQPGDESWKRFRALGLTDLHGAAFTLAHQHGKSALVVQTWSADPDGSLIDASQIRDESGFDFEAISNLPPPSRPDFVAAELIWQQWRNEFTSEAFGPSWTHRAARAFRHRLRQKHRLLVHVELTRFGSVEPTLPEFEQALRFGIDDSDGATFYDYELVLARGAQAVVKAAYAPTGIEQAIERRFPRHEKNPLFRPSR